MVRRMSNRPSAPSGESEPVTHFGFRTVPEAEKASMVREVFDSVAPKYDLMNDLMSFGIHRLWKAALIERIRPRAHERLLDVAGGTGDIAFRWRTAGGGPVLVCDINREMLAVGRDRALDRNIVDGVSWNCGDAEALPVQSASMDVYTIAFGLRNVTHIEKALSEAARVLKPGGRFFCLEFSKVVLPGLDMLYDRYSFSILPWLGKAVAGDAEAYRYLAESIRKFPKQEDLADMIRKAGLDQVKVHNLSGGIAAIHAAWRI